MSTSIDKSSFRYFNTGITDSQEKKSFTNVSSDVVKHIFSYLKMHQLGVVKRVSKNWSRLASTPILWQSAIYREMAFSRKNWAQWDPRLVEDVDLRQEMLTLPKNIMEVFRRSAFPGKSIRETHLLVRMPKGFTLKKLDDISKKHFPNDGHGYIHMTSPLRDELEKKSVDESVWLLMTKDILPQSKNKSYIEQKEVVENFAKIAQAPYQIPTVLEALTCLYVDHTRSQKSQANKSMVTNCQESIEGVQISVMSIVLQSIFVGTFAPKSRVGIAALRKF